MLNAPTVRAGPGRPGWGKIKSSVVYNCCLVWYTVSVQGVTSSTGLANMVGIPKGVYPEQVRSPEL